MKNVLRDWLGINEEKLALETQLNKLQQKMDYLDASYSDVDDKVDNLESEVSDIKYEVDTLQSLVEDKLNAMADEGRGSGGEYSDSMVTSIIEEVTDDVMEKIIYKLRA